MLVENEIIAIPTAIVCDDIRREDNGKEFLVGVYSADIIPMAMPVVLTQPAEWRLWLTAPAPEALHLQRPLPNGALQIVAAGPREDATR